MKPNSEQTVIELQALADLRSQIRCFLHSFETILKRSRDACYQGIRFQKGKG